MTDSPNPTHPQTSHLPIKVTEELFVDLRQINREVNRLKYKTDPQLYNREDFWTYITDKGGDCEDYALEKRRRLLELGYPAHSLLLAVCRIPPENGGHAVLTVDTSQGTYVLDNNHPHLYPWTSPPYPIDWVMRQSPITLGEWTAILPSAPDDN